ncbi:hypothetical protein HDU93_003523 [Gonapodya sp. JEL0774]|nr:hypothetical protein HDU93_003523 [Gonapodya sp. JEL0774]
MDSEVNPALNIGQRPSFWLIYARKSVDDRRDNVLFADQAVMAHQWALERSFRVSSFVFQVVRSGAAEYGSSANQRYGLWAAQQICLASPFVVGIIVYALDCLSREVQISLKFISDLTDAAQKSFAYAFNVVNDWIGNFADLRKSKDESKGQRISIDAQRGSGLHQTFFHDMKSGARPPGLGKKDRDGLQQALSLVRGDQDASPAMKTDKMGAIATLDEDGNAGYVAGIASYRLERLARDGTGGGLEIVFGRNGESEYSEKEPRTVTLILDLPDGAQGRLRRMEEFGML